MFNIAIMIIVVVLAIALGVGYNLLVIRKYPERGRKFAYVVNVIVFLLFAFSVFALISVNSFANNLINEKVAEVEESIAVKYPNNILVKGGIDLNKIKGDVSQANIAVSEFRKMLPTHNDLKMGKLLYDFVVDNAMSTLQKQIVSVEGSVDKLSAYTGENSMLTVSSLINGIKANVIKILNRIILVFIILFTVLFLIYIIKSVLKMRRETQK